MDPVTVTAVAMEVKTLIYTCDILHDQMTQVALNGTCQYDQKMTYIIYA